MNGRKLNGVSKSMEKQKVPGNLSQIIDFPKLKASLKDISEEGKYKCNFRKGGILHKSNKSI